MEIYLWDNIDEIGKYKKHTKSNVSKAKSKSKHKHILMVRELLLANDKYNSVYKVKYCTECGKIYDLASETVVTDEGYCRMLHRDELLEKYKDLPHFTIPSIMAKFVSITHE